MERFVGVKNNRICVVSNSSFNNQDLEIIKVPDELSHISDSELITSGMIVNGQLVNKNSIKPANKLKLALVGNWKMRCGIATYAESLWPHVAKHMGDFKLFIEKLFSILYNKYGLIFELGNDCIYLIFSSIIFTLYCCNLFSRLLFCNVSDIFCMLSYNL